jgi:PAS domain S-box-containing protein
LDVEFGDAEAYRASFDHAAVGVAHVGLDGRFVRVNPAFAAIAGRTSAEMAGLAFPDITHPDDLDDDLELAELLLAGEIADYSLRKRYLRPDGTAVWVQLTGSLVRAADGAPRYFVAVVDDIDDRVALEQRERRAREEAELTADVVSRLEGAGTVGGQAEALVDALVPRFADYATVEAPDEDRPLLAAAHRDPVGLRALLELRQRHRVAAPAAGSAARTAGGERHLIAVVTPELLDRYEVDRRGRRLWHQLAPRSHMSVPVDLGEGRRGAVLVGRTGPHRAAFTEADLDFLDRLARRAGAHLVGADLRERDHRTSLRLQEALLSGTPAVAEGVEVAGRYQPAAELLEVGGDWYDSLELPDGRLLLVVGDVVGHGLEAAAVMGRLRAGLGALAAQGGDPARLLDQLDVFARGPQGADFATVVCAALDPSSGELVHACAGHPPVLVVGPVGDTRWLTTAGSPPLCTYVTDERPQATTRLEPGSLLVLYSDGLLERRGESLTAGLERLRVAALSWRHVDVEEFSDRIIAQLLEGTAADDDVVVLAVRYRPEAAHRFRRELPARPGELAALRADLTRWADRWGVRDPSLTDLQLAVGEAAANAVEHAFVGRDPGRVRVEVDRDGTGHLQVTVGDDGRWLARPSQPDRGRGRGIMESLCREVATDTGPDGTVVTMTVPLRAGHR